MPEVSDVYSGDSTKDSQYALLKVIKADGTIVIIRVDNDNVMYVETT